MAGRLAGIVGDVVDISEVISDITNASLQQHRAISSINESLIQINDIAQKGADASVNTAAAANDLDKQVEILRRKLSFFKTRISTLPSIREILQSDTVSTTVDIHKLKNIEQRKTRFSDGEVLIYEGEGAGECMYIVLEGYVEVYKNFQKPNVTLLATVGAGSILGEMALFLKGPRTASAVAKGNVLVLEITNNDMNRFINSNPHIAYDMIETLCVRLSNILTKLGA